MIIHHVPWLVTKLFPAYTWHKDRDHQHIYLTFDDGPVPGITDKVLELLDVYNYKATFFMVGHNVFKYPSLCKEVLAAGHQIGNHTYHHLNGNSCSKETYLADFNACQEIILETLGINTSCFRPPYGRINADQAKEISKSHEIVMWDVLSGDYNNKLPVERIIKKTIQYTRNGSIIIFHDQQKTAHRLPYILPDVLKYISNEDFLPVCL
ncbi:polysaccharide deacetylase family protein [Anditalea andensis]|uniref:Polysaccharide deacetylase n=1 Tax=Anditalea andensis TaxID=1048983 RepID=A0A074KYR5_9BACT|nr:polysaccharide deacetylase family protein [Anditalea andensis]KEO72763.1 polysaccharide deacetylase [Anditalea andensis]